MPNKKITAMPSLAGNQVPTDLVTAVDLSAAPVNQNVKSTLNDLFAVITKNITDRAVRFQAPGSAPAVSSANQGALYHNGSAFLASSNGGAFEPLLSLSPQISTTVLIGPVAGSPNALPSFRALQFTDLPSTFAAGIYGRNAALDGSPQAIQSTAGVLNWIQTPSSANLSLAVTDGGTGTGALVLRAGPQIDAPYINSIRVLTLPSTLGGSVLRFAQATGGGNNCVELVNAANNGTPILRAFGSSDINVSLNLSSKGSGNITLSGAAIRAQGSGVTEPGIFEARGGNQTLGGGKILFYEQTTNGNNFVGFEAPDIISTSVYWTLPATDGTAGQVLSTDGAGILSWATRGSGTVTSVGLSAPSIFTVANSPVTGSGTLALSLATQSAALVFAGPTSGGAAAPTFRSLALTDLPTLATASLLGRSSAGTGTPEQITSTAAVLTWLQNPTSSNLAAAMTDETGTGNLVFSSSPSLSTPTISSGNLNFSSTAQRIVGIFSENPVSDRVFFQTSVTNSNTTMGAIPNGTGFAAGMNFHSSSSDFTNYQVGQVILTSDSTRINSRGLGTAAAYPLFLQTADVTRIRIETNSNIGINTSSYGTASQGVIGIGNATTVPTGNPSGGGVLYVEAGALKYRGSSGTITTLGNA